MIGIIVVWKERKVNNTLNQRVSTTAPLMRQNYNELQKNKPEATHSEVNDIQLSKENPQYMEIIKSADRTIPDKVIMQDNPSYSIPVKMQDNPAYAGTKQ